MPYSEIKIEIPSAIISAKVQEVLLEAGCKWNDGSTIIKRQSSPFIFVDENGRITISSSRIWFDDKPYKEVHYTDIIQHFKIKDLNLAGCKIVICSSIKDRHKLLKYVTMMPEGKRKYILMHKRAYDLLESISNKNSDTLTLDDIENAMSLELLLSKLKKKINA